MTHADLVRHYGSGAAVARRCSKDDPERDRTRAMVWSWKIRGVPLKWQFWFQRDTRGKLKVTAPKGKR